MARQAHKKTRASAIGGALGPNGAIDAYALTDAAGVRRIAVAMGSATQNTAVRVSAGPLGFRGILLAAFVSYTTKPAGGTLAATAEIYDASADAAVVLATADPESLTNREGGALTLQAINDTTVIEPDDTLESVITADNNTVTAAGVGGVMVFLVRPIEASDGTSTVTGGPTG